MIDKLLNLVINREAAGTGQLVTAAVAIAATVGFHLDPVLAAAIITVVSAAATWFTRRNVTSNATLAKAGMPVA